MISENWALVCELGFWGWVLSTTGMIVRTFTRRDFFDRKSALRWGTGIIIFYILWVYGMTRS